MTKSVPQKSKGEAKTTVKQSVEYLILRLSKIRYSQVSIRNTFRNGGRLGELLDDIYHERCLVSDIKMIKVARVNGQWVSADNRRLWVFKSLQQVGKLKTVRVRIIQKIPPEKMSTKDGGLSVKMRGGDPGGQVYKMLQTGPSTDSKENKTDNKKKQTNSKSTKIKKSTESCRVGYSGKADSSQSIQQESRHSLETEHTDKEKLNEKSNKTTSNIDKRPTCSQKSDSGNSERSALGELKVTTQNTTVTEKKKRKRRKKKKGCKTQENSDKISVCSDNGDCENYEQTRDIYGVHVDLPESDCQETTDIYSNAVCYTNPYGLDENDRRLMEIVETFNLFLDVQVFSG